MKIPFFPKKRDNMKKSENKKNLLPYDRRAKELHPLSVLFTIVPRHQEDFFLDSYFEDGAAMSYVLYAYSKPPAEILSYLGADETKKSVVMTLGRSEYVSHMLITASQRFATSDLSRGIAFSFPISKIYGIAAYRFLSDEYKAYRLGENRPKEKTEENMKMENEKSDRGPELATTPSLNNDEGPYDVVYVIVNKGYTDLVMEASRKAGARGGTILTARGTGNPEMEKYYGFSIQPEKEIVVILVKREISEKVLAAVYEAAGLSTNGQGVAFVVPAGRTAGLTAKALNPEE